MAYDDFMDKFKQCVTAPGLKAVSLKLKPQIDNLPESQRDDLREKFMDMYSELQSKT